MFVLPSVLAAVVLLQVPSEAPPPVEKPKPKRPVVRSLFTTDEVSAATFTETFTLRATGPIVLRTEILLGRAKFSPGEMNGIFGNNLARAVIAYRRAHFLTLEPMVDRIVWDLLNTDAAPLFTTYTLTKADVNGPFTELPSGMEAKASLKRLGYTSMLEMLGERFHIEPKLLAQLNRGVDLNEPGSMLAVPNVATPPPGKPASLVVNGTDLTLQGLDAAGHILLSYPVSVGSKHDPLPAGNWRIVAVHKNPTYFYDSIHFWDVSGPRSKARLNPGPNNPVGLVWISISKAHYGIHGTPSPASIGRGQSHGCIRLTNWDALELAQIVEARLSVVLKSN